MVFPAQSKRLCKIQQVFSEPYLSHEVTYVNTCILRLVVVYCTKAWQRMRPTNDIDPFRNDPYKEEATS